MTNAHHDPLINALLTATSPMLLTDEIGQVTWANDQLCSLSGYHLEEMLGRTPAFLKSGRHDRAFYGKLWQTILGGKVWHGEIIEQHREGTTYAVEQAIVPLFNKNGIIKHFLAVQHELPPGSMPDETQVKAATSASSMELGNRLQFEHQLHESVERSKRSGASIAVLLVDIDRFKKINDEHGAALGDELLHNMGLRLRAATRNADAVAHLEADQYGVVLPGMPSIELIADRAANFLRSISRPYKVHGTAVELTARMGIALYPRDGEDYEVLLLRADEALYQAACRGGNRYMFAGDT